MKKRIISLILVVVMSVLALSGCAYRYEKDDMTKYATFNKDAFLAALADSTIKITDADFGTDEATRLNKVEDKIFADLAKKAEDKITEGTAGKYDVLYYCYYATAVIDGNEHVFFAAKMEEAKPTNFQLGLSTLEGLNAKIAELVKDKDIKDYVYSTATSLKDDSATADVDESKLKAGDVVYVSYTKSYNTVDAEGKESKQTVTVAYEKVTLADDGSFASKLIGNTVGTAISEIKLTDDTITAENKEVTYTGVKVNWLVKTGTEIGTVVDTTYTATKTEKDVNGKSVDLKDKELTYHIFPVYYLDVADELTAEIVLDQYYSNLTTTDSREEETTYIYACMDAGFKNGDTTLLDLANELKDNRSALSTAESAEKKAQEAVDKAGDNATDSEKNALTDAKAATETAQKKVDETEKKILEATNEKGDDIKAALVDGARAYQYYTFETAYETSVVDNVAKELFALASKYITYKDTLPKKAVKEAYERIENGHKLTFYTGEYSASGSSSSSSNSVSHGDHEHKETNYAHYNGDYDQFMKVTYFTTQASSKTMDDVKNKMTEEAEEAVRDVILVYVLKDALEANGATLAVTDEQEEEFKLGFNYWYLEYQYGDNVSENDYMTAILFNNIFDYLLERKDNVDNKVVFERLTYGFKTEEETDDTTNK